MPHVRPVAVVLGAAGVVAALACGGIAGSPPQATDLRDDASTLVDPFGADATASMRGSSDMDGGTEKAAPVNCDDAVALESGVPFACAPLWPEAGFGTCWSATQYCYWDYNPTRQRGQSGCYPFPCDCGTMPSCACLDVPGAGGGCTDDGGIVIMWGPNGLQ